MCREPVEAPGPPRLTRVPDLPYLREPQRQGTGGGAYLLLLGWAWMNGGRVPNDHTKLAYITRCSVRRWRKIAPTVRAFFTLADGFLTQSRLTEELQKAVTRSNRAKVAANEGWSKRKSLKDNEAGHATASPQAYG